MLAQIEPFWSWHTPIAWTGYIFFIDGSIWHRRGESPIRNDRAEMVFLAIVSVPLWVIFEEYNKHTLWNWHYVGLPETLLVRYFGYVVGVRDHLAGDPDHRGTGRRDPRSARAGLPPPRSGAHPARRAGVDAAWRPARSMLLLPIVYPSPWLAAPVWLGFIFLLDPINAQLRRRVAARRPPRAAPGAAGQPAGRGPGLRAALGVLELLGAHQVGLHRAGPARHQAVRDAAGRLPRLSRLCRRVLRDVRLHPPLVMAWLVAADRTIISRLWAQPRRSSARSS